MIRHIKVHDGPDVQQIYANFLSFLGLSFFPCLLPGLFFGLFCILIYKMTKSVSDFKHRTDLQNSMDVQGAQFLPLSQSKGAVFKAGLKKPIKGTI